MFDLMGQMFGALRQNASGKLVILTATSGDTGSAVAHAFYKIPNVEVMVLFPPAEVSPRQRKQMTTLGGNVTTIGVDGKFDDCQAMVKRAFAEYERGEHPCETCSDPRGSYGPDPYQADVNGDTKDVWMCEQCRCNSADDI